MARVQSRATSEIPGNVLFLPGLYNDTVHLLLEAHEYFQLNGPRDQERITPPLKLVYSCEMSRITMRLSSVMAWLMVQKAVLAGKITPEESTTQYPLDSTDTCLYRNEEATGILPSYMSYLLDESHALYERVHRLDRMMRGQA